MKIKVLKIKDWLSLQKPDYEGLRYHIETWQKDGMPYGLNDIIRLAKAYNCPPPEVENGQLTFVYRPNIAVKHIETTITIQKTNAVER